MIWHGGSVLHVPFLTEVSQVTQVASDSGGLQRTSGASLGETPLAEPATVSVLPVFGQSAR